MADMKNYDSELVDLLCRVNNKSTMSDVLSNLLTPDEREEINVRLQIFNQLLAGHTQRAIAKNLGVGIATITRGNKELKYGKPGVRKLIRR